MTIDEAIKRFSNNAEYERSNGSLQGCLEFRQLAEWLAELKEFKEQTGWIPVSERLPKSNGVYIVTREFNDGFERSDLTDACYFDGTSTWHDDNRINHGREYVDKKIKAWMTLPEPYKAESEDDE